MSTTFDPEGVIIDGAVPRSDSERYEKLIDYATALHEARLATIAVQSVKLDALKTDWGEDFEEVENDLIDLIAVMLPEGTQIMVGEHCPGDVVVVREDETEEHE